MPDTSTPVAPTTDDVETLDAAWRAARTAALDAREEAMGMPLHTPDRVRAAAEHRALAALARSRAAHADLQAALHRRTAAGHDAQAANLRTLSAAV